MCVDSVRNPWGSVKTSEITRSRTVLTQVKEEPMGEAEGGFMSGNLFPPPLRGKSQAPLSQPTFPGRLPGNTDPLLGMVLCTVTQVQLPRIPLVFRTHPHALFHLHSHPHLRKTALRVNSLSKALRHCGSYRKLTEDH